MRDADKTKEQLLEELSNLRNELSRLKTEYSNDRTSMAICDFAPFLPPPDASPEIDRTSRRVKESKQSHTQLADSLPQGIVEFAANGKLLFVNHNCYKMFGYTKEDFDRGLSVLQMIKPAERQRAIANISKCLDGLHASPNTYQAVRKDGTTFPIAVYTSRVIQDGRPAGVRAIILDVTEQKKTENALRTSEKRFRSLFETSKDSILLVNHETGGVLAANPAACQLYGYSQNEFCALNITDISAEQIKTEMSLKEDIIDIPYRLHRKKDGTVFPVEITRGYFTEGGVRVHTAFIRDITKRTEDENALRVLGEKFEKAFAMNPAAVAITNLEDGRIIEINEAGLRMFRYDRHEAIGTSTVALWPAPKDRVAFIQELREKGVYHSRERILLKKSGEHFVTLGSAELFTFNGEEVILSTWLDITERKQLEEALRQSEEVYRTLIAASPDPIIMIDSSAKIGLVSEKTFTLFEVDPQQEVIGHNVLEWVAPNHRSRALAAIQSLFSREASAVFGEFTLIRDDGTTFIAEVHGAPIQSLNGAIPGATLVIRDITERKNLEAQLLHAQKMEAIGVLAGGIAHDFNNILMVVMGYMGLIERKAFEDHEIKNYSKQIQDCVTRAANLTRGLLAFSRKAAVELKPQSVKMILKDCEKLFGRLLPADVEFNVSVDEDVKIMADVTQIHQILMNMVSNAKDAMPRGGTLLIQAKAVQISQNLKLYQRFIKPGYYALISISDSGVGMDEATQKKIFEPFFTTKEVGAGTGLGLSITYGIVKQHNGYITVSSKPGSGTTFDIYLPLVELEVFETEKTTGEMLKGAETLLLAEDDKYVREMIGEVLRECGYKVVEVEDGVAAVKRYKELRNSIDLLILDVVMPGKNGKETYDEIQKFNPAIPAIFMSGYTGDIVINKGIQDTIVNYVSKPVSPPELLSKVRQALEK